MPTCQKCGAPFPVKMKIDGRVRVLNKRKFCLDCSPFGKHNTKNLTGLVELNSLRICDICTRQFEFIGYHSRTVRQYPDLPCGGNPNRCASCQTNHRRINTKRLAVEYAGGKCVLCGYSRCIHALVFHHLDPAQKEFPIASFLCCSLDSLRSEIDKCVLLCSNCHTEIHYGLVRLPENLPPHPGCELFHSEPRQKRVPSSCIDCGTRISFSSRRCQRCESLTRRGKPTKVT